MKSISIETAEGLRLDAAIAHDDPLIERFYQRYDRAFFLPNEKESFEGFIACHAMNSGQPYAELSETYGPFREFTCLASSSKDSIIGGVNFIAFPVIKNQNQGGPIALVNLNYIFIDQEHRRRGLFRRLVRSIPEAAYRLLSVTNPSDIPVVATEYSQNVHIFIEQNDPFRMPQEDYELDSRLTGLDQRQRIAIWAKLGAKLIDFPYAQPPLSSSQEADHTLVYGILGANEDQLDSCELCNHLRRFFGVSVLKGHSIESEPTAARQVALLEQMCLEGKLIPLLDGRRVLELPERSDEKTSLSLVEVLRTLP